jgi:hypothetical protein
MVKITLINMKEEINENKQYKIYKPAKILKNNYEIIFDVDELDKEEFIQFILYVKFTDTIIISNGENQNYYEIFPYNGISYSCKINRNNNLSIKIKPLDLCTKIIINKYINYPLKSMILNHISWDNIFIINLPRRTDRKELMNEILSKSNITKYEFIEAFDGLEDNIKSQYNKLKKTKKIPIITSGHYACLLSHIKAIKKAKENGYSRIMILEDDVFFEPDIIKKIQNMSIPEFDLLYLGGITSKKKIFNNGWGYSNGTNIMGAYAYILSRTIYDVVLDGLEKMTEYVDFFYLKKIQPNYRTIILNDVIKTDLTSSDTSHKSKKMIRRIEYIK